MMVRFLCAPLVALYVVSTHGFVTSTSPRCWTAPPHRPEPAAGMAATSAADHDHEVTTTTTAANGAIPTVAAAAVTDAEVVTLPNTYVKCGQCQSIYPITVNQLGRASASKGRRLECSVCGHSWFQSKDRLLTLRPNEFEMVPLPDEDLERIQKNLNEGKVASFLGDCKIYVGNIAFDCHEDDLLHVFGQVGEVGDVSLVRDPGTGQNRGFGFVTMRTLADGQAALTRLDGTLVRGRKIAVREANA